MPATNTIYLFYADIITWADFAQILNNNQWQWFYGERMENTILCYWKDREKEKVSDERWQHARAFDADSELTWWRQNDGTYTVRLFFEQEELPTNLNGLPWHSPETWHKQAKTTKTLLYGEWKDKEGKWREESIPDWLNYPVRHPTSPVTLWTETYVCDQKPITLTRLLAVETMEPIKNDTA